MRILGLSLLISVFVLVPSFAFAQKPKQDANQKKLAAAEKEVKQFFDAYAEDLRQHRREAIANRYDSRGAFMLGNGRKEHRTFNELRSGYVEKWKGPKSFEWKDLSFEMISPTAAAVLGKFEWETPDGKIHKYSYTGVLVKRDGQWRIRVEDESTQ